MIKRIKNKYLSNNVFIKLLPFFVFLVLILILIFLKRASLKTFWIAAFFGLMTAFIVSDKEDFQKNVFLDLKTITLLYVY